MPKHAPVMLGITTAALVLACAAVVVFRAGIQSRDFAILGVVAAICVVVIPPSMWLAVNYLWPVLYPNMRYSDGSVPWRLRHKS